MKHLLIIGVEDETKCVRKNAIIKIFTNKA